MLQEKIAKTNLDDYINPFSCDKRIVLLVTKENHISVITETDDFFQRNSCENEERNLEYIELLEMILINILFQIDIRPSMEFG